MKTAIKVIGLSAGTRSIGYAVCHDKVLHDWRMRSFKEKWSENKLQNICNWLNTIIREQEITAIAMKIPHPSKTSIELQQLIDAIKKSATNKGIDLQLFCIEDLHEYCFSNIRSNKATLMDFIVQKYPELTNEYQQEKGNMNSYHIRIFEAIAAVCVMNSL